MSNADQARSDVWEYLPVQATDVICQSVDQGAVLLSAKDEVYYGLNPVGLQIWENLAPKLQTVDELATYLSEKYPEVAKEVIRADVEELLDDLLKQGLVETSAQA